MVLALRYSMRGNSKIGPVLEVTTSHPLGKDGVEIGSESINKDHSHSWVKISQSLKKLVSDLIDKEEDDNEQETSEMQFEIGALKTNVLAIASRLKAKAKPQRRVVASVSTKTIPIEERKWTDIEPEDYSSEKGHCSKGETVQFPAWEWRTCTKTHTFRSSFSRGRRVSKSKAKVSMVPFSDNRADIIKRVLVRERLVNRHPPVPFFTKQRRVAKQEMSVCSHFIRFMNNQTNDQRKATIPQKKRQRWHKCCAYCAIGIFARGRTGSPGCVNKRAGGKIVCGGFRSECAYGQQERPQLCWVGDFEDIEESDDDGHRRGANKTRSNGKRQRVGLISDSYASWRNSRSSFSEEALRGSWVYLPLDQRSKTTYHQKGKKELIAIYPTVYHLWFLVYQRVLPQPHLHSLLHHLHHRIPYLTSTDTPKIQYKKGVEVRVRSYGETAAETDGNRNKNMKWRTRRSTKRSIAWLAGLATGV